MSDFRARIQTLSQTYRDQGQPLGWFEEFYVEADGNEDAIPWADRVAHPLLQDWLTQRTIVGEGRSALVIGCGLGEDSEALAALGFRVTAFDLSPTAIAWCQKRFPNSAVHYQIGDLFEPPSEWIGAFDFVLEIYTIQAMPPELHDRAIRAIAQLVAPQGQLLVITRGRSEDDPLTGPPFHLTQTELSGFEQAGLTVLTAEDLPEQPEGLARHFRVLYQR